MDNNLKFDYNTTRPKLNLPEYGRNVQKMVEMIKSQPDREKRNRMAQATVHLMSTMHPQQRDLGDFRHKLWDHLAVIANYQLDVDSPYTLPTSAEEVAVPERLTYRYGDEIRFKHYGRVIQDLVGKLALTANDEHFKERVEAVGNIMKRSYLQWNRDTVDDDVIFHDMMEMARGRFELPEGVKLRDTRELQSMNFSSQNNQRKNQKNRKKKNNQQRRN